MIMSFRSKAEATERIVRLSLNEGNWVITWSGVTANQWPTAGTVENVRDSRFAIAVR